MVCSWAWLTDLCYLYSGTIKEYRDIPPYTDNADDEDNGRLLGGSRSARLLNDEPVDYESTNQRDYMPSKHSPLSVKLAR